MTELQKEKLIELWNKTDVQSLFSVHQFLAFCKQVIEISIRLEPTTREMQESNDLLVARLKAQDIYWANRLQYYVKKSDDYKKFFLESQKQKRRWKDVSTKSMQTAWTAALNRPDDDFNNWYEAYTKSKSPNTHNISDVASRETPTQGVRACDNEVVKSVYPEQEQAIWDGIIEWEKLHNPFYPSEMRWDRARAHEVMAYIFRNYGRMIVNKGIKPEPDTETTFNEAVDRMEALDNRMREFGRLINYYQPAVPTEELLKVVVKYPINGELKSVKPTDKEVLAITEEIVKDPANRTFGQTHLAIWRAAEDFMKHAYKDVPYDKHMRTEEEHSMQVVTKQVDATHKESVLVIDDVCPHCHEDNLKMVPPDEPWHDQYLICPKCCSTYLLDVTYDIPDNIPELPPSDAKKIEKIEEERIL